MGGGREDLSQMVLEQPALTQFPRFPLIGIAERYLLESHPVHIACAGDVEVTGNHDSSIESLMPLLC